MGQLARWFLLGLVAVLVATAVKAAEPRWLTLPEPPAMPTATVSGFAAVNGIEMYYAVYGAGEPVLLIHGGLANADTWANEVIALARTHRVIVADSRGHGRSTRTAQAYGYDLMASDYLALLDFLKIERTSLVGWSDGGIIGIDIAMTHPERLIKLFAQAANVTPEGVKPNVEKDPIFAAFIKRAGDEYRRLSKTPTDYDNFVAQIGHMWDSEPHWTKEQLAAIKVPMAIVLGDHDEAIERNHTEMMAAAIPNAKLIILKDVSHFALLQDPDGYTRAVEEFLK